MDLSLHKEEEALTKAFTAAMAHTGGPYLDSLVPKVHSSPLQRAQLAFLLTY